MTEYDRVIIPTTFMAKNMEYEAPARVMVDPAGLMLSQDPEVALFTAPLGACLGVAIYDPVAKVGGLLHSLLPTSSIDPQRAALRPGMFLDTGLTALFQRAQKLKVTRENLRVIAAGAAEILDETTLFNIGKYNYEFFREFLRQLGVGIFAEKVGGQTNCSMELRIATGAVRLRYSGQTTPHYLCKP